MSVAWVAVGATVLSTAVGASAAEDAEDAQYASMQANERIASQQQKLAQDQWDYQKNVFLPRQMARDDAAWELTKRVGEQQLADSAYYRGLAGDSFDQAKKSWKYQDEYMGLTDKYLSGEMGNTMAGEVNADVEQAYGRGLQDMVRQAQRYGINPGSPGFSAAFGDMYQQKMLAQAGGATMARRAARDKAEQMVGIAAGAGQAGFGTGLGAAGLATGAGNSATSNTNAAAGNGVNTNNSFNSGQGVALRGFSDATNSWNNVARIGMNSPTADFYGGLASSLIRSGGFGSFGSSGSASPWVGGGFQSGVAGMGD